MSTLAIKLLRVILAPFDSWASFLGRLKDFSWPLTSIQSYTGWLFLLSSVAVSWVIYQYSTRRDESARRQSFRETVFPREVYLHHSAILDYKFVLFDKAIRLFLYVPLFSAITYKLYTSIVHLAGPSTIHLSPTVAMWFVPVYAVCVTDFSFYVAHRAMHRVPFLWPFHEVHHSAEVLTPLTIYRVHPVEELVTSSTQSAFAALSAVLFTAITNLPVDPLSIFGLNVLTFGFFLFGFQLRHSHVWLSYGPLWSRFFISPAQHQVHHSLARKHWDKNFGFMLAVWDLIFGSLYVPRERERIIFGCGTEPGEYSTLRKLYLDPFFKSFRVLQQSVEKLGFRMPSRRMPALVVVQSESVKPAPLEPPNAAERVRQLLK